MVYGCDLNPYSQLSLLPLNYDHIHKFNMFHTCTLNDNSIYTIKPANSIMWIVFSTCYSLPTCFNHCHSHTG